jgi:hypothetical protein
MPYTTIYYWPDGVWCFKEELTQYHFKGDDYASMDIQDYYVTYEQIDALVDTLVYFWE